MSRPRLLTLTLALLLAACAPAPAPTATPRPTLTPTLAPAPSPTPTVGAVPQRAITLEQAEGQLRIVQAAPESGAVDVYLEQALIAGRIGHGAFTNPVPVATGAYYLQVVPANALPDTQVLADTTLAVEADQTYLVVITGTADALVVSVYQEDLSPIPAGKTRLAFLNAVPRGSAVTGRVDAQPFADSLDFGHVSATYLIDSGAHRVAFYAGDTLLAAQDTVIAPQQMVTAVLIGQRGGQNTRILLLSTPVETPGQVRFIHAAPETSPVSITLNGETLVESLPYRQASDWQQRDPGNTTIQVIDAASGATLAETRFNLGASQAQEIVLLEDRGRPALRLYPHNLDATAPGTARLVAINAAPYAPPVYAHTRSARLDAIPMIPGASASRVVDFPSSTLELLWLSGEGEDSRVVEWTGEVTFRQGHAYTCVITGTDRDPFLLETAVGVLNDGAPDADSTTTGPQMRLVNALSESLAVRVRLGETLLVDQLAPQSASPYVPVQGQAATLRVGSAGGSPNLPDYLIADLPALETGATVLLYGDASAMRSSFLPDTPVAARPGQALLRVINAFADESALVVSIDQPSAAGAASSAATHRSAPVGAGDSTGYITLPPGQYDVTALRAAGDEVLAIVPELALETGTRYDLVLMSALSGAGYDILLLQEPLPDP